MAPVKNFVFFRIIATHPSEANFDSKLHCAVSFGLFKDALGYKERDFVFLNSDQALYRFKCRMLEYMQLHPGEQKAVERRSSPPRFP